MAGWSRLGGRCLSNGQPLPAVQTVPPWRSLQGEIIIQGVTHAFLHAKMAIVDNGG